MQSIEAEGDSIESAIRNALARLGVDRDRVEIEILSAGSRGLFGIGSRRARVRASLRGPVPDGGVGELGGVPPDDFRNECVPSTSRQTRDDGKTPIVRSEPPSTAVLRGAVASKPTVLDGADDVRSAVQVSSAAGGHEAATSPGESSERAALLLRDIVQHMGVSAEVAIRRGADHTVLELTGDTSGVLIGRRGQMLDALEYIVNRILSRDENGATHFVIDSENYRLRRRETLEDLARRMAAQAKKKGRPVALNPMSPRDRRIVHLALQADPTLTTRSSGSGHFRKLVIIPDATKRMPRAEG